VLRDLVDAQVPVLGVDIEPRVIQRWEAEGVAIAYGSADDHDLVEELPLSKARWVVSTVPDPDASTVLITALRSAGYRGEIGVTGNDPAYIDALLAAGADHVFVPVLHVRRLGIDRESGSIAYEPDIDAASGGGYPG
jgi:Trk K+ transport system NAD-binding subunit